MEDMIPTVGFNMRKVTKGNVTIKVRTRAFPVAREEDDESPVTLSC